MRKQTLTFVVAALALIISVTLGISMVKKPTPQIPTETPQLSPSQTTQVFVPKFRTYRNEAFGFEFQYVTNYEINDRAVNPGLGPRHNRLVDIAFQSTQESLAKESLAGHPPPDGLNYFSIEKTDAPTIDMLNYSFGSEGVCAPQYEVAPIKPIKEETLTVGGIKALRVTASDCYHPDRADTWLLFVHQGYLFDYFSSFDWDDPAVPTEFQPLPMFLQTFRVLPSTE